MAPSIGRRGSRSRSTRELSAEIADSRVMRIRHHETGALLAEGPNGWGGILHFAGRLFVAGSCLCATPEAAGNAGVCPIRGVHEDVAWRLPDGSILPGPGYRYPVPNPLLPYLFGRVVFDPGDPRLSIEP